MSLKTAFHPASLPSPPGPILEEEDDDLEEATQIPRVQIAVPSFPATFLTGDLTTHLLSIAHTDYNTHSDLTTAIQCALLEHTRMNSNNPDYTITRRTALLELASVPLVALGQHSTLSSRRYEEMLRFCTAALEACWELYRGSDTVGAQHAFDCTCAYIPLLKTIAHDSSHHRKLALDLAAQYALVQTMLSWKCLTRTESISYAQNALDMGKASGNILLQFSAHSKLSYTYRTAGRYFRALETMQEGEATLKRYQRAKRERRCLMGLSVISIAAMLKSSSQMELTRTRRSVLLSKTRQSRNT